MSLPPTLIVREKIDVLHARAGLSHHAGNRVAPRLVMGGLFVPGRSLRRPIHFDQDKACRVSGIPDEIETRNTRFLNAVARIIKRRSLERLDLIGLHVNVHMNDMHERALLNSQSITRPTVVNQLRTSGGEVIVSRLSKITVLKPSRAIPVPSRRPDGSGLQPSAALPLPHLGRCPSLV
jgi:hypothetical protein